MGLIDTAIGIAVPGASIPLRILGGLRSVGAWLLANPIYGVAITASLFAALEHHEAQRWHKTADQRAVALAAVPVAQAKAKAAQIALNAHIAAQYQAQAEKTDANYKLALAQASTAADRYIAAHRMRVAYPGATGGANPAAQAGNAGLPAAMPSDGVILSAGDVQGCSAATAFGVTAHNWAVDQVEAGLAVWGDK